MIQVQSYNNSGLFRTRKSPVKHGRLFIRRSKIYRSITNNSSHLHDQNLTINYRSPPLRYRRIRRKILDGAGDEKIITPPSSSIDQKQIDFTELEQIFDNAIRNRLPVELYKEKSQAKEIIRTQHEHRNSNPVETRIDLSSSIEPNEEIKRSLTTHIKQHKILSAIIFVTLSALLGFFSVFIFLK